MGWAGSVLFSFAWVLSRCDQFGVFYCPSHAYIPASVASFSHVFEGRDLSRLDDGRCPHDVDVLRCLYIPPLSTPQARSLRMQLILIVTDDLIDIFAFIGRRNQPTDVLIAFGFSLAGGW